MLWWVKNKGTISDVGGYEAYGEKAIVRSAFFVFNRNRS